MFGFLAIRMSERGSRLMKKPFFIAAMILFSALCIGQNAGAAAVSDAPVVIEIFSTTKCNTDPALQEEVLKLLENDPNIMLVNCRKNFAGKKNQKDQFSRSFCDDRTFGYFRQLGLFTIKTPQVIVNGMLESGNDVMATINAARSLQKTYKIDVKRDGAALNIRIPAFETQATGGQIMLYAYAPTQDKKVTFVDSDVELDDETKQKIAQNVSVPFVTKTRLTPLQVRPVMAQEYLGKWVAGKEMNLAVPVGSVDPFFADVDDLGFVVVVHAEGEFGYVLASGEMKSRLEYPMSKPEEAPIHRASVPRALVQ